MKLAIMRSGDVPAAVTAALHFSSQNAGSPELEQPLPSGQHAARTDSAVPAPQDAQRPRPAAAVVRNSVTAGSWQSPHLELTRSNSSSHASEHCDCHSGWPNRIVTH